MSVRIPARKLAPLSEAPPTGVPAYRALAGGIRDWLMDGRLVPGAILPSERALTQTLGVSRTTVSRAYQELVTEGYAATRRGSGTVLRFPGAGPTRLSPFGPQLTDPDDDQVDFTCAASAAPAGLMTAVETALGELGAHARGIGYHPRGLPALREAVAQRYRDRGLPTDPENILIVPGALAGAAVVARARVQAGDRVLIESPTYPNAAQALRAEGARLVGIGVGGGGWHVPEIAAALRRTRPRLAMLIPDYHNPTGALMDDDTRTAVAAELRTGDCTALVDETMAELDLDGAAGGRPAPFAAQAASTLTLGSMSKSFWGGIRVGWIRAPRSEVDDLYAALSTLSLGCSVIDELVAVHLLADADRILAERRASLRRSRDALVALLRTHLPTWEFGVPSGGLTLWCRLPEPIAVAVAGQAERLGVYVVPGVRFSIGGGMAHHLRLPYAGDPGSFATAVERLRRAYDAALAAPSSLPAPQDPVTLGERDAMIA